MAQKIVKTFHDGDLIALPNGKFCFKDVDGSSEEFDTAKTAEEEYCIKQALDYHGSAIRDNTRSERIEIGQRIDNGDDN